MKLKRILDKYSRPTVLLGAEPVKKGLLTDLQAQKRFNNILYVVLFVFVCSVGVLSGTALLLDLVRGSSKRIGLLVSAGVGLPFMLGWISRVVREWSQLNLLITLVSRSDESAIQSLIQKLLTSPAIGLEKVANYDRAKRARQR